MSRHNGLPGYDAWVTRSDDADNLNPGDDIACDNCGEMTRIWDWSPAYDRMCLECLARIEDDDSRADRGDWECHQERDR